MDAATGTISVRGAATAVLACAACVIFLQTRSVAAFAAPSSAGVGGGSAQGDAFDTFVEMRTGLGPACEGSSDPVFWTGHGELYEAPSGKILATFEGLDVCKGVRLGPDHVRQLSRKVFWFRDAETGEVLTEYGGKPVRPIRYDSQVFEFRRSVNKVDPVLPHIMTSVVRGPRIVPVMPCTPQWVGPDRNQMLFNVPVFIDMEIPHRGRYQAYEFYDYVVEPSFPEGRPPSAVWYRQGSIQPFVTNGKAVMHSIARRVASFEGLPESIRTLVENDYPLFCTPPADLEEVDRLQAAHRQHHEKIKHD